MPIYEYSCLKTGEVKEVILPLSEYDRRYIICPIHFPILLDGDPEFALKLSIGKVHDAKKIWSLTGDIQIAPSSRVFVNPMTGESQIAVTKYDQAPQGFKEIELKGPIERSKFEKHDTEVQNVINEFDQMRMDDRRQHHQKMRHDDINAKMNSLQTETYEHEDGRIEEVKHFLEPIHKKMLKESMKHSRGKRVPKKITERRFAVNHMSASNLQDAPQNKK